MSLPYKLAAMASYFSDSELMRQTAAQLNKDLSPADPFTSNFEEEPPYDVLFRQVYPLVMYWYQHQTDRLLQALYRIDLPEEKIRENMSSEVIEDLPKILTDLILKRTLQKVCIRNHFKSGEKGQTGVY